MCHWRAFRMQGYGAGAQGVAQTAVSPLFGG